MENSSKIQTGIFGFITLAVLVLSIITMAVCFSLQSDLKEIAGPSGPDDAILANGTPEDSTSGEKTDEVKKPIYVLKIDNGTLVVLDKKGQTVRTIDCHTPFLPASDYQLLTAGINVYSEEELSSLIEDFSS